MTTTVSPHHVFISYSRRDEAVMWRIAEFLRGQRINVWVDNEKLVPGTPIWEEEIEKAIKNALAVVVVMSPDAKNSEWVRREISLSDQYQKRIFPVLVRGDENSAITLRLVTRQYINMRENEEAGMNFLSTALSQFLDVSVYQSSDKSRERDNRISGIENEQITKQEVEIQTPDLSSLRKKSDHAEQKAINTIVLSPSWISVLVLWITIGWTIGGAISGFYYTERVYAFGSSSKELGNPSIGWIIGGAIGGLATASSLRAARILFNRKSMFWIVFGGAIAGVVGLATSKIFLSHTNLFTSSKIQFAISWIGFSLGHKTEVEFSTASFGTTTGWVVCIAIAGLVTAFTLLSDRIISNWKNVAWITSGWLIGGVVATIIVRENFWSISRLTQWINVSLQTLEYSLTYLDASVRTVRAGGAIAGCIVGVISSAIGGLIMIWQIRKEVNTRKVV